MSSSHTVHKFYQAGDCPGSDGSVGSGNAGILAGLTGSALQVRSGMKKALKALGSGAKADILEKPATTSASAPPEVQEL